VNDAAARALFRQNPSRTFPSKGRYQLIRLRKAAGAVHPMAERLNLCRIDFRFLNSPERHRPRCSSQAGESTASNSPSKHIGTSAGRAHAGHLTFGLRSSCERAELMLALVTRVLMGDDTVDLICTDPPYNVPIDGHVCGSGRIRHRDFAMGAGEMNKDQFTRFLVDTLGPAAARCRDGAIAFVFMDWRHIREVLNAGEQVFSELKNLCVWNKTNGGMGTFYRSKHELVFIFKIGTAPHTNTFGLGETGRYRTTVWDYAGVNTFRAGRLEELELHPTVKPVDLVSDAIKDCTRRGGIVLDPFGGSGTTLIAAQKSGRTARLIEFDPSYCDVIIRRFEAVTGSPAILAWTGQTFEERAAERAPPVTSDDPSSQAAMIATGEEPQ
jgi:DNA modification methylase